MNVHIFNDSAGIYSDLAIKRIEKLQPGNNIYINLLLKKSLNEKEQCLGLKQTIKFLNTNPDIHRLLFHFYESNSRFILEHLKINKKLKIYWIFWSAEFYNMPDKLAGLYDEFSTNFLPQFQNRFRQLFSFPINMIKFFLGKPVFNKSKQYQSYQKINYFCGTLRNDYLNVVKETGNNVMKYLPWAYISVDELISTNNFESTGTALMIGHSADPTLNHYSFFKKLSEIKFNNKVILVLAYGNFQYRKALIQKTNHLLKNHSIEIQKNLMSRNEYFSYLQQVGFAVFNNKVQQAFGNIIPLLWMGVKIFLRKENSIYKDLKEWGVIIFNLEDEFNESAITVRLTENEKKINRNVLLAHLPEKVVNEQILVVLNS